MARQVIVINLVIEKLALVSRYWVSPKQPCNVLCHHVIETGFVFNQLFVGFVVIYLNGIIVR